MAEFYSNLPPKDKDELQKTVDKLTTTPYQTEYEFNVGEYDSTIAFFVKRNFSREAAESTAYAILSQAKIDNIKPQHNRIHNNNNKRYTINDNKRRQHQQTSITITTTLHATINNRNTQ